MKERSKEGTLEKYSKEMIHYRESLSKIMEDVGNSYEELGNPRANSFYSGEAPRMLDALAATLRGMSLKDDFFIINHYPQDSFLPEYSELVKRIGEHIEGHLKRLKINRKNREQVAEASLGYIEHLTLLIREQMPLTDEELDSFDYFVENL